MEVAAIEWEGEPFLKRQLGMPEPLGMGKSLLGLVPISLVSFCLEAVGNVARGAAGGGDFALFGLDDLGVLFAGDGFQLGDGVFGADQGFQTDGFASGFEEVLLGGFGEEAEILGDFLFLAGQLNLLETGDAEGDDEGNNGDDDQDLPNAEAMAWAEVGGRWEGVPMGLRAHRIMFFGKRRLDAKGKSVNGGMLTNPLKLGGAGVGWGIRGRDAGYWGDHEKMDTMRMVDEESFEGWNEWYGVKKRLPW